jgi:curved DNA-binding protein CbpA
MDHAHAQAKDSSEDCWQILGLSEDADKKAVKSAYAKRLKKTRPDEDPEGFQRLHAAYKRASQLAKKSAPKQTVETSFTDTQTVAEQANTIFPPSTIISESTTQSTETPPNISPEANRSTTESSISPSISSEQTENIQSSQKQKDTVEQQKHPSNQTNNIFDDQPHIHHHKNDQRIDPSFDDLINEAHANSQTDEQKNTQDISSQDIPNTPFPKSTHYQIEADQATKEALAQQKMNDDELVQDWEVLFMRATGLLNDPKRVNHISEWQFIERLPSMLDLQFKAQASDYLFGLIAEANEVALEKKALYIKQPTLDYLNQFFAWEDKWLDYNENFSESLLNSVYPFLSTEKKSNHTPVSVENPYYKRILAFTLDTLFAFSAAYGLALLFANNGEKSTFVFFILKSLLVYFLVIIPVMEFTRLQASIGKWILGLHVINRQGLKIGLFQSFWRSTVTFACVLGIKIIVWFNLFFMYRYNVLTQDLVSRSYVTHSGKGFGTFLKRLLQKTKKP